MDKIKEYISNFSNDILFYLPKIALAIVIFWIGLKTIKKLDGLFNKLLEKMGLSSTIRPFLVSIIDFLLYIVIFFVVAGVLGINLSIFASIIAASVFAIGMSLQGSLSNFASGILVLSLKPYKSEDFIQIDDKFGKVEKIDVFSTTVVTPGNKTLIIPNSKMTTEILTNYSKKGNILLDVQVAVPYEESFPKIKKIIEEALVDIPEILKEPKTQIGITKFESHSVVVSVWPYIKPEDFWETTFKVHENIKNKFYENGIKVAYAEGFSHGHFGA